jgi:hypothetical protein
MDEEMDEENTKPVIAIDVDGVLNPDANSRQRSRLWYHHGWRRGRARLSVGDGGGIPLIINPETGVWLQKLAREAGADLLWATRWNSYANAFIAPLAGLPPLPYVVTPPYWKWHPTEPGVRIWWPKASSVLELAAGRPLVWFDDEPAEFTEAESLLKPGQQFLGVLADPEVGLTESDVGKARAWLSQLALTLR